MSHVGDWDLVETMTSGTFGDIFIVRHRETGRRACAKIERLKTSPDDASQKPSTQLHIERATYQHLTRTVPADKQKYFPRIFDFGTQGKYVFMVMELFTCDLESTIDSYSRTEKLLCLLDTISALESMHNAGVLHRDIKPRNICVGRGKSKVALIDLGLSKKFIQRDGSHIPQKQKSSIVGTFRYASIPTLLSLESSRRDDVESLVYTFVNIFGKRLPWQDLNIPNLDSSDANLRVEAEERRIKVVLKLKQTTAPSKLFRGVPSCLQRILERNNIVAFTEAPNYALYREFVKQDLPDGAR